LTSSYKAKVSKKWFIIEITENLHRKVVAEMNEMERRVEREEQKEIIGMGGIGKERNELPDLFYRASHIP